MKSGIFKNHSRADDTVPWYTASFHKALGSAPSTGGGSGGAAGDTIRTVLSFC